MELLSAVNQMVILLVCVIVGVIAGKTGVMTREGNKSISNLVINITCPAMILSSAVSEETTQMPAMQMTQLLLLCIGSYAVLIMLAIVLPKLLRVPMEYRGLFSFALVFSNAKFMGFPVIDALLGEQGVFYAAVFNIPFDILLFTVGVWFISGGKEGMSLSKKTVLSPSIVASVVALVLNIFGIPLPAVLGDSIRFLGAVTSPAAMLVLGASIGGMSARAVLSGWKVNTLIVMRQFLIPIATYLILSLFLSDPIVLGMVVLTLAMPIGSITTMFCLQYGADEQLGSKLVFLSTLVTIAAVPILVWILPI